VTGNGNGNGRARLATASVLIVSGLFYAWDVVEAALNLQQLITLVAVLNTRDAELIEAGLQPAVVPWVPAVTAILLPPVAFALAVLLGRGRSLGMRALCLAAGLAVVAALTLSVTAFA
jgi:hypothetical protein